MQFPLKSCTFNFDALSPIMNLPKYLFRTDPKSYSKTIIDFNYILLNLYISEIYYIINNILFFLKKTKKK